MASECGKKNLNSQTLINAIKRIYHTYNQDLHFSLMYGTSLRKWILSWVDFSIVCWEHQLWSRMELLRNIYSRMQRNQIILATSLWSDVLNSNLKDTSGLMVMTVIPGINKKSSWRDCCSLFVAHEQKHLPFTKKSVPDRLQHIPDFMLSLEKKNVASLFNIKPLVY